MDRRIKKLQGYLNKYLGKRDVEIIEELGLSKEDYLEDTIFYKKKYKIFFRDDIAFYIKDGRVADIYITECFLWIGLSNIFYYEDEYPQYRVINLIMKYK